MNKFSCALLCTATLLASAPAHAFWFGEKTDSVWADKPVALDGKSEKWHPRDDDDDDGIVYAFANDSQNLYLMLSPHTKAAKDELAGSYDQDFTIWLDTQAGKSKTMGIRLSAPENDYDYTDRSSELIGLDSATVAGADLNVGPVEERGIVEARIPLSYFGNNLPEKISVGITTSPAKKTPPHTAKAAAQQGKQSGGDDNSGGVQMKRGHRGGQRKRSGAPQDEDLTPLDLWIRVSLAEAPVMVK